MTTIATNGVDIAADGLRTAGCQPVTKTSRKIQCQHGRLYAVAGVYAMIEALIEWHHVNRADPAKVPPMKDSDGWSLLVIDEAGQPFSFTNDVPYAERRDYPLSVGSGRDWALAAMELGKSPEDAVRFAIDHDVYSGGEITVVNIAEALALKLKEAAE